eukprot:jgi/Botrbrau1/13791/Bobra.0056s0041.1
MNSVTALRRWLVFVGMMRFFSVYLGYFHHKQLEYNLFDLQPGLVHELYGRTFAIWTMTTCGLCFICARNPRSPAIYGATMLSFILAGAFFLSEVLLFKTLSFRAAAAPLFFAGISGLWMAAGWNYYTIPEAPQVSEDQEIPYEETLEQKQD